MRVLTLIVILTLVAGRAVSGEVDLSVVEARLSEISEAVSALLLYVTCTASIAGLLLGLYLWRLVMLARNQRDL